MEPPPPHLRVLDTVQLLVPPQHPHGESESPSPLPLSGLDADPNVLDVTFRTVRFFPPHPVSLDPLHALQRAFAAALGLFPQLAGSLRVRENDLSAVVVVFSSGTDAVPLDLAASDDLSVADVVDADAPDSPLLDLLAPADSSSRTGPALALQATRLACGGVALGMRVAHALCDGAGATRFLAAAARFARGEPVAPPVWERRELLGPRNPPRVVTPSFDTVLAPDDDGVGPYGGHGHEQQQQLLKVCFHVSDARVETLRARLAAEAAGVKLTTFEVLAAFIWRARVKANGTSPDEVVKMVYSMNISKLLDPPLPEGYWGNVCVPVYVSLTSGDLLSRPLAETASLIRKSKREVDDEYVRSYVDFLELHRRRRREGVTATAGRGGLSAFTDWRRLGHAEVDFGWGGPDAVLPLSWRILGSEEPCFLLPYGAADERRRRGFKVFVAVRETAVPCFTEEMEEILLLRQEERSNNSTAGKL